MPDEEKIALSKLRLENAKERLSFIPGILELGDYKTAANRAYYAVFMSLAKKRLRSNMKMPYGLSNVSRRI